MARITKKAFVSRMKASRNRQIAAVYEPLDYETLSKLSAICKRHDVWRTVTESRSNCLIFSDESRLYFDSFAKRNYFAFGDDVLMVSIRENGSKETMYLYYVVLM